MVEVEQYHSFPACGSGLGHRQGVRRRNAADGRSEFTRTSAVAPSPMRVVSTVHIGAAKWDSGRTRSTTRRRWTVRISQDLGRTGPGRSSSRCAIEPKIVLAHQSHPFRDRYDLAGSIILEVKPGADWHEQDCNANGSTHHNNLLAVESAFAPDSDPVTLLKEKTQNIGSFIHSSPRSDLFLAAAEIGLLAASQKLEYFRREATCSEEVPGRLLFKRPARRGRWTRSHAGSPGTGREHPGP